MNRLTKIVYFGVLAILSAVQLLQGNPLLASLLFAMTCLALPLYEKREAKRQFYRALRKLYVCVDLVAFKREVDNLEKHALMKRAIETPMALLTLIESYYIGNRESMVQSLTNLPKEDAYLFWIDCYMGLSGESPIDSLQIRRHLNKVPRYYRDIATQRCEVLELMQKLQDSDTVGTDEIEALRGRVTTNLLIAELTKCLRDQTHDARIRKYYDQATINLSKGLII